MSEHIREHTESPHATMVKIAKLQSSIAYYAQYSKECETKIAALMSKLPQQYRALVAVQPDPPQADQQK